MQLTVLLARLTKIGETEVTSIAHSVRFAGKCFSSSSSSHNDVHVLAKFGASCLLLCHGICQHKKESRWAAGRRNWVLLGPLKNNKLFRVNVSRLTCPLLCGRHLHIAPVVGACLNGKPEQVLASCLHAPHLGTYLAFYDRLLLC
jgi:hypothetical protein